MNETPRTDNEVCVGMTDTRQWWVPADFARQLERELTAMTAEKDTLKRHLNEANAIIEKRMAERDAMTAERDSLLKAVQDELAGRTIDRILAERIRAQLAAMTADRDSWIAQCNARVADLLRVGAQRDAAMWKEIRDIGDKYGQPLGVPQYLKELIKELEEA